MKNDWHRLEKCFLDDKPTHLIRLMSCGTSPDLRDECNTTLLMHACGTANLRFVFVLISFGSKVDLVNDDGENALEYLCVYNDNDEESRIIIFTALIQRSKKKSDKAFLRHLEALAKGRHLIALSKSIKEHCKEKCLIKDTL